MGVLQDAAVWVFSTMGSLILLQLASVSEQVTVLSGALAAERTKGESVSAELDELRSANKERDNVIKQQQVRGRSADGIHTPNHSHVVLSLFFAALVLLQEDIRALRQTSANLSAQLESLRHRMASAEGEGGSAPRPIPVAFQELNRLREEVAHGTLEVGDLEERLRVQGEQLELAVERATTSQDAVSA